MLDKHFNKLFLNLPVRHVYRKLDLDDISTDALLDDLVRNMKITNFFILARYNLPSSLLLKLTPHSSPEKVSETLRLADSKMLGGASRTWIAGSLGDLSEVTGDCCDNMTVRREGGRGNIS